MVGTRVRLAGRTVVRERFAYASVSYVACTVRCASFQPGRVASDRIATELNADCYFVLQQSVMNA